VSKKMQIRGRSTGLKRAGIELRTIEPTQKNFICQRALLTGTATSRRPRREAWNGLACHVGRPGRARVEVRVIYLANPKFLHQSKSISYGYGDVPATSGSRMGWPATSTDLEWRHETLLVNRSSMDKHISYRCSADGMPVSKHKRARRPKKG
jgi:hypothetical protein